MACHRKHTATCYISYIVSCVWRTRTDVRVLTSRECGVPHTSSLDWTGVESWDGLRASARRSPKRIPDYFGGGDILTLNSDWFRGMTMDTLGECFA